jgi:hypothetical protein
MSALCIDDDEGNKIMAHEMLPGPHPNISVIRLIGEMAKTDFAISDELGLPGGRSTYLLIDTSSFNLGLPDNFLELSRNSYLLDPNFKHAAVYAPTVWIRSLGNMVAKLTRQRHKLSMHDSFESAMAHLQEMVRQAGL